MVGSTVERNFEYASPGEVVGYTEYREICDKVNRFRKIGIQSSEGYESVVRDVRTIFGATPDGKFAPLLAPIEYEIMYDVKKCKELTGKDTVFLLGMPLNGLDTKQLVQIQESLTADAAVIVEEFDDSEPATLPLNIRRLDFEHPDLASIPGHEKAWMASYYFDLVSDKKPVPVRPENVKTDLMNVWRASREAKGLPLLPDRNATGTFIFSSRELAAQPAIVEGMWSISKVGFGEVLGAHHPVAMEFDKKFFDEQVASPNTMTAVHFVDGEPMCFGFIAANMNDNDWINTNSTAISSIVKKSDVEQTAFVHFHELISKGDRGMGYSTDIIQAFLQLAAATRHNYRIFFESTNLSSLYIPSIIDSEVDKTDLSIDGGIHTLDTLYYWAFVKDDKNLSLG